MWRAAGVVVLIGHVIPFVGCHRSHPAEESAWAVVQSTARAYRSFESRIADVPFSPLREIRSASPRQPRPGSVEQFSATAALKRHAEESPSDTNYRRAAAALLLVDDLDRAVDFFQRAVAIDPDGAIAKSDLAAAYLTRGDRRKAPWDFARAMDAAQRAVTSVRSRPEPWFNLGLAQERLGLFDSAAASFREAARLGDGPWEKEAAQKAADIPHERNRAAAVDRVAASLASDDEQRIVRVTASEPDIAAEVIERRLLRQWAEAAQKSRTGDAAGIAERAATVAAAIRRETGDPSYGELVAALQACARTCAIGWLEHLDAVTAWDEDRYDAVAAAVRAADLTFGQSLSPINLFRVPVRVTIARIHGRSREGRRWLRIFAPYAERRHYWALAGRMRWQLALISSEAGDVGDVFQDYQAAASLLERARDREGSAVVAAMRASEYQQLDDLELAWSFQAEALRGLTLSRPLRRNPILSIAAMLAAASSLDAAAITFRTPLINETRRRGSTASLAFMLAREAQDWLEMGYRENAASRLAEARVLAETIKDPGVSMMARAVVRTAEGRLLLKTDPGRAAIVLNEAIGIYRDRADEFAMPALQLARGQALARADRDDMAEAAFRAGITAAERERTLLAGDQQRVSILGARWDLYASLADLLLQRNENEALALLQRSRAVNLLERTSARTVRRSPFAPAPGTIAIEYAVLPSGIHGWITTGTDRKRFSVAAPLSAVVAAIDEYRQSIAAREDRVIEARARGLFQMLLGPIRESVSTAQRVVIVPDGPLHEVPFAALQDSKTLRYLIEGASLVITPSLEFYARPAPHRATAASEALIVGNPERLAAALDSRLPPLAAAEREAEEVARLYSPSVVVTGNRATRRFFVEHARKARVIHFAGHAVASSTRPEMSRLLMAPSADDRLGALFASDIDRQSLGHVRLVVLSACDTAAGRVTRGEGVVGLVRAFLSSGVPSVVATLWPVDDRSTALLFTAFHRAWAQGLPAADALREAQLNLLRNRYAVVDWAGAVVIGQSVTP